MLFASADVWRQRVLRYCLLGAFLGVSVLCLWLTVASLAVVRGGAKVQVGDAPAGPLEFPWSRDMPPGQQFTVTVPLQSARFGTSRIRIVGDDCVQEVRYDGKPLSVPKDASACDIVYGFALDLPRRRGTHTLTVRVLNNGGPGALDVRPELSTFGELCIGFGILSVVLLFTLRSTPAPAPAFHGRGFWRRLVAIPSWRRQEHLLLCLYLASRGYILWKRWGALLGYDAIPHMEMVKRMSWWGPLPRLDECFYCYHPPVGFWLAKALTLLGLRVSMAIQGVSAAFMLLGFLALRATVRWVGSS